MICPGCEFTPSQIREIAVVITAVAVSLTVVGFNIKEVRLWFMRRIEKAVELLYNKKGDKDG